MASTPLKVLGSTAAHLKDPKVQFVLTGFKQDAECRVFAFEDAKKEKPGILYTVRVDLAGARRHGIPTQELPLLCRGVLERLGQSDVSHTVSFTDDEMSLYASHCKNARREALLKKKSKFKGPTVVSRIGWRTAQPGSPQTAAK